MIFINVLQMVAEHLQQYFQVKYLKANAAQ